MDKFIYVFSSAARDKLAEAGFVLLKADEQNSTYVFALDGKLEFAERQDEFSYITSDMLTF